jgi:hypothetical protein
MPDRRRHIHLYASFDTILKFQLNGTVITQLPQPRLSIPFSACAPDSTRQFCFSPTHPNADHRVRFQPRRRLTVYLLDNQLDGFEPLAAFLVATIQSD